MITMSGDKIILSLNSAMNITCDDKILLQVTFTQSLIEVNLFSNGDDGLIKGNIDQV